MNISVPGVAHRALPSATRSVVHVRGRVRCFSSSGHVSFIEDVAATQPPKHLHCLLKMLQTRGESILSPGCRRGTIPLVVPLSENLSGSITALLRWPTAPDGVEMPVVEVRKHGVWLLANNVDQYIHRILVEEDASKPQSTGELFDAASEVGNKLYKRGDFAESQISNLDSYLLKKVGFFPDILERKVLRHFAQGDHVSAMVTGEFYTKKDLFPGFARPFVFYAEILQKSVEIFSEGLFLSSSLLLIFCYSSGVLLVLSSTFRIAIYRVGRSSEAKDAARVALRSPWWTLGCAYKDAASLALWDDEQIEYIKEKVSEEGRQEDLKKGKAPAQIALDEAAFLLDLGSIEGTWDGFLERIAECYREAGYDDIARFVLYTE